MIKFFITLFIFVLTTFYIIVDIIATYQAIKAAKANKQVYNKSIGLEIVLLSVWIVTLCVLIKC